MRLIILILLAINLLLLTLLTFSLIYRLICEIKFNKRMKQYYDKQK